MAKNTHQKLFEKAKQALERQNYDLAIFSYLQILTVQPENAEARTQLRATQARAAAKTGGSNFKCYMGMAKAHVLKLIGKKEQAILACENALNAQPGNVAVMKLLAETAAEAELNELAAWQRQEIADKHANEDTDNLFDLAEIYRELKRPSDAIKCYERIKEIDPDFDVDQELRDVSAMDISDAFNKGARDGARAILKDDDESAMQELLAGKLRTDEQRDKAIKFILDRDVKNRPDDHQNYAKLGDICFDMEDWARGYKLAKDYYLKAQELNSTDSAVRMKIGDLEIKELRHQQRQLQAAIKKDPQNPELRAKLKALKERSVAFQIEEYERRVKEQPLKNDFHFRLGELYFQTNRYDAAIGELQTSAKDPKFKIASLTMLGRALSSTGQLDMAIAQFERAMKGEELFDKIKETLYFQAQAFENKGDPDSLKKALAIYTRIYEVEISFRDVKEKVPALQQQLGG